MEEEKREPATIVIEDIEAWKKEILERQFSDIFNRATEQWRTGSRLLAPTHP